MRFPPKPEISGLESRLRGAIPGRRATEEDFGRSTKPQRLTCFSGSQAENARGTALEARRWSPVLLAYAALDVTSCEKHARGVLILSAALSTAALTVAVVGYGGKQLLDPESRAQPSTQVLLPPPLLLRDVAPKEALAINERIPLSREPNPPAKAFQFLGEPTAYGRALECLTSAIYYEAASERLEGQRAVAQVVLNRMRHPAFADSVCGVVYHGSARKTGCQFSFTCDGSLSRQPSTLGWARSAAVAKDALSGTVFAPVGHATHYHAKYVVPYWATSLSKNAIIGAHIFYRWVGWWGQPPAFSRRYAGKEIDPRELRAAALRSIGDAEPTVSEKMAVLVIDPRVELVSVIQFLAAQSAPTDEDGAYEKEVRAHFSAFSDHSAVQIYRQLSAEEQDFELSRLLQLIMHYTPPPHLRRRDSVPKNLVVSAGGKETLLSLMKALRDFSKRTNFAAFVDDRKSLDAEVATAAGSQSVSSANAPLGRGQSATPVRVILTPLLQNVILGGCEKSPKTGPEPWVIITSNTSAPRALETVVNARHSCREVPLQRPT